MHLRFALMIMVEEVWWFGPKLTIGCGDEQANEYGIMVPVDDEQRHGVHRADVCGGGSHGEYGTCRSNLTLHKTFAAKKKCVILQVKIAECEGMAGIRQPS